MRTLGRRYNFLTSLKKDIRQYEEIATQSIKINTNNLKWKTFNMTSTLPRSECPPKVPPTKLRKANTSSKGQATYIERVTDLSGSI